MSAPFGLGVIKSTCRAVCRPPLEQIPIELIHKRSSAHSRESGNPGATCSESVSVALGPRFRGDERMTGAIPSHRISL
jgi:hypothetical protein